MSIDKACEWIERAQRRIPHTKRGDMHDAWAFLNKALVELEEVEAELRECREALAAAEARERAMRDTLRNLQAPYGSWFDPDFRCLACKRRKVEPHADDCAWVNAVERKSDTAALHAALEQARINVLDQVTHRVDEAEASPVAGWGKEVYQEWVRFCQRLDARIKRQLEQARAEAISEKSVIEAKKRIENEIGNIVTLIGKGALEAIKEQARAEGEALGWAKATDNPITALSESYERGKVKGATEERERCLKAIDYWREFSSVGLEKVKPFENCDSESKTRVDVYRGAIHVLEAVENTIREADEEE